jgi:hypothetical protein
MHMLDLQMTEDELKDVVDEFDADKSGTIEYSEFCALMARKMKEVRHQKRAAGWEKLARESPNSLPDSVVDMSVEDKGFREWFDGVWTPFLKHDAEFAEATAQRRPSAAGEAASRATAGGGHHMHHDDALSQHL